MQLCRTCSSTGGFPALLAACCASRARLAALLKLSGLALRLLTMPDTDNTSGCHMPATATSSGGFLLTLGFKMLKLSVTAQQLGEVNWTLLAVTFSKVRA